MDKKCQVYFQLKNKFPEINLNLEIIQIDLFRGLSKKENKRFKHK